MLEKEIRYCLEHKRPIVLFKNIKGFVMFECSYKKQRADPFPHPPDLN